MKIRNLLSGILNAGWAAWQDAAIISLIALAAAVAIYIIVFLFVKDSRIETDGRRMAKRAAWYEKQIEAERQAFELEKEANEIRLAQSRRELAEKEAAAAEAVEKAADARRRLEAKERAVTELLETAEINKKELAEYQRREGTDVPEDIIINILTSKTLGQSVFAADSRYTDCKIPLGKTFNFTAGDVKDYIRAKPRITFKDGAGQKPASFKAAGKTAALVHALPDNKVRVTFKCGPAHGAKLCKYPETGVTNSKFPYGLSWFTISNETAPCSLELIKQTIDISYRIARLGY